MPERNASFCPILDGRLYVEVPDFDHLLTLLLQQRWRRFAHLKTKEGYVPYFGGGIAFDAWPMILRGVKPRWYLEGDYQKAVEEALASGFYEDSNDVAMHQTVHPHECEWQGPLGMEFSMNDVDFVWVHWSVAERIGEEAVVASLRRFLPDRVSIFLDKPL